MERKFMDSRDPLWIVFGSGFGSPKYSSLDKDGDPLSGNVSSFGIFNQEINYNGGFKGVADV